MLAAGCGGAGGGGAEREAGPVAVLYVLDHAGADPPQGALAPYEDTFQRVLAGCRIRAGALANRILHLAEDASYGSGRFVTNLEALRALAGRVGPTKRDCTDTFIVTEAMLGGPAAR